MNLTFITGNPYKAAYTAEALGTHIAHKKVDLDEIQAVELRAVTEHKLQQAFALLKTPVLVEDVGLEFHAFGRLPGPFIKWFVEELGNERICKLLTDEHDRSATARICYGLHDGRQMHFFEASMKGEIAKEPRGSNGFGWDQIFIKEGMGKTRAELSTAAERETSMRCEPLQQIRAFLEAYTQKA